MKKLYFVCLIGIVLSVLVHAQNSKNFILDSNSKSSIYFFTGLGNNLTVIVPGKLNGQNITTINGLAFCSKRTETERDYSNPTKFKEINYSLYGYSIKRNITKVIISPQIKNIDHNAFSNNRLETIIIGENVNLYSDSFPLGFADYYNNNGKKAGKYTANISQSVSGITTFHDDNSNIWDDNSKVHAIWNFSSLFYTDEYYYQANGSSVNIVGYTLIETLVIIIPSEIDGLHVTSIEPDAFNGIFITGITIGENVSFSNETFIYPPSFFNDYNNSQKRAGTYQYGYDDYRDIWYKKGSFGAKFKFYPTLGFQMSWVNWFEFNGGIQTGILASGVFPWSILGEAGIGLGYARENAFGGAFHYGGILEIYFNKTYGLGIGGGSIIDISFKKLTDTENSLPKTSYLRAALLDYLDDGGKGALFFDWYGDNKWGIGLQFGYGSKK